jgi:7-cyano-7-deazaguanine reductase
MSHLASDELSPEKSELGKKTEYNPHYNPDKLFPIPRKIKRDEINVPDNLPFVGFDLWNHYELSWLNEKGKPVVALAEIIYGCESLNIIESKSMKLYFNSFNNTKFKNAEEVQVTAERDLTARVGAPVAVKIISVNAFDGEKLFAGFEGAVCIDDLDIECSSYTVDASILKVENEIVEEVLYSDLLKSNCLVTNQPDWGSVEISYKGKKINRENLLRYIVSFRNHNEFHEQCIERIFMDIMRYCQPEELTVYGRYTRRGGLDINPYRSTTKLKKTINSRLCRQ